MCQELWCVLLARFMVDIQRKDKEKERKEKGEKRKRKMESSSDEVGKHLCLSHFALCSVIRALSRSPRLGSSSSQMAGGAGE